MTGGRKEGLPDEPRSYNEAVMLCYSTAKHCQSHDHLGAGPVPHTIGNRLYSNRIILKHLIDGVRPFLSGAEGE